MHSQPFMSLDIGSHSLKAAVYVLDYTTNEYILVCTARTAPTGISSGACFDRDIFQHACSKIIAECERKIQKSISDICIYITGTALEYIRSRGEVLIVSPDAIIRKEDIDRAVENCTLVPLKNKALIDIKTDRFFVDTKSVSGRIEGMEGTRLEIEAHLVVCDARFIEDISFCMKSLRKNIQDITAAVYSEALAITKEKERRAGCAVIHIGAEATELLVFENTYLSHRALLLVGGNKITEDITLGLACTLEEAEAKKHKHTVTIGDTERATIRTIVDARIEDILDLVVRELKKIKRHQLLPGGIILSGGGSLSPQVIDHAKSILKLPIRIASIDSGKHDTVRLRDARFYVAGSLPYVLRKEDIEARPRVKTPSIIGLILKTIKERFHTLISPFLP